MARSEPETDEATAEVVARLGVVHWTILMMGEAPAENSSVRLATIPGAEVDERYLDNNEAEKVMFELETE